MPKLDINPFVSAILMPASCLITGDKVGMLRNIAIEFSHTLRRNNHALRLYSR